MSSNGNRKSERSILHHLLLLWNTEMHAGNSIRTTIIKAAAGHLFVIYLTRSWHMTILCVVAETTSGNFSNASLQNVRGHFDWRNNAGKCPSILAVPSRKTCFSILYIHPFQTEQLSVYLFGSLMSADKSIKLNKFQEASRPHKENESPLGTEKTNFL